MVYRYLIDDAWRGKNIEQWTRADPSSRDSLQCECKLILSDWTITQESYNWIEFIYVAQILNMYTCI